MSKTPSPSVVRSQRNDIRRPTSHYEIELEGHQDAEAGTLHPDRVKLGQPESLDLDSHGKLKLVKEIDHLGYFSTRLQHHSPSLAQYVSRLTGSFDFPVR